MSSMTCPKCHGSMRTYERSNVHVDQCTECRGIFLDRGELEHLIDGEQRWAGSQVPPPQTAPPQTPPPQYGQQYQQPQYQQPHGKPYKKKRSFLEDLFD